MSTVESCTTLSAASVLQKWKILEGTNKESVALFQYAAKVYRVFSKIPSVDLTLISYCNQILDRLVECYHANKEGRIAIERGEVDLLKVIYNPKYLAYCITNCKRLTFELLSAAAYLNIVCKSAHFDLKLENLVLIPKSGGEYTLKVIDLGSVKRLDVNAKGGSLHYFSSQIAMCWLSGSQYPASEKK